MARKTTVARIAARPKKDANPLAPLTPAGRTALAVPAQAIAVRESDTTLVSGAPYVTWSRTVPDASVYYIDDHKKGADGPWLGEADKIAWRDAGSGYECIIMRHERGHLCGYVGVPPGHPLHGFDEDAIPGELDVEVHGGLDYAAICQHGPSPMRWIPSEARRVCHAPPPPPPKLAPVDHATEHRAQDADAWWFGFSCDKVYDLIPDEKRSGFLASEVGRVYRNEGYVHDQVINLAAQLRAVADGAPKPRLIGEPPPPIGLDPQDAL